MRTRNVLKVLAGAAGLAVSSNAYAQAFNIVTSEPGSFIPNVDDPANLLAGSQADDTAIEITLPAAYHNLILGPTAYASTNGRVISTASSTFSNAALTFDLPSGYYPMWDDLDLRVDSANNTGLFIEGIYTLDTGSVFVVQWNARPFSFTNSGTPDPVGNGAMFKMQLQIRPSGGPIIAQYLYQGLGTVTGQSATIGLNSQAVPEAVEYAYNIPGAISDSTVLTITPGVLPPTGACCYANGTCAQLTQIACTNAGGTYAGNGVDCAAANCPQPWNEQGDAGDLPSTAQIPQGSGTLFAIAGDHAFADADMYQIRIADPGNFSATTVNNASWDTTLFLFDANGIGIVYNDDTASGLLQSTLTNSFVASLPAGDYYLAITRYSRRATTGGELIFPTTFPGEFGPNLFTAIDGWINEPSAGGAYTIVLTGVEYSGGGPTCYANCDLSTQSPILNVADFSCFLTKFAASDPYANCDASTQPPVLNVADFSCFLTKFAAGCP